MTTEERQLSEMLHRITPEPPRRVTVEDVAFRLAGQPVRRPRLRRGSAAQPRRSRGWVPALAALSVFAVAGTSAGIAEVLSSHHGPAPATGGATASSSTSTSVSSSASSAPQTTPTGLASTGAVWPPNRIAGGIWDAQRISLKGPDQDSLVASANSLYEIRGPSLDRVDPATGAIVARVAYSSNLAAEAALLIRPVVTGDTVWVVASYIDGLAVLHGYNAVTLAQVASVTVPSIGGLPFSPGRVLSGGPGGQLYLAIGDGVAVVNAETRQVVKRITVDAGQVTSVAVSPDGSKVYVGVGSFRLLTYDLATGREVGSSTMKDAPTSTQVVFATSGGVWGIAGVETSDWVWYAPDGDLTRMIHVTQGTGAGLHSIPNLGGGAVWIGGGQRLVCADPVTGQTRASVAIPTVNGVLEYLSNVAVTGGHAYALYVNPAARAGGIARLTPPPACSG